MDAILRLNFVNMIETLFLTLKYIDMTIIVLIIALLPIFGFAAFTFKGNIKPNEKKSMTFKSWLFSFTINHEKGKDLNDENTEV
jgi:NADH:ubiquinone oxidoreductase subunit H